MKTILAWTVLAAALVAPLTASAGSASAASTGFNVRLIDLDPLDGISPAIAFRYDDTKASAQFNVYDPAQPWGAMPIEYGYGLREPSRPTGSMRVEVTHELVSASASASGPGTILFPSGYWEQEFVLTPSTKAVFSVPYAMSMDSDHPSASHFSSAVSMWGYVNGSRQFGDLARMWGDGTRSGTLVGELSSGDAALTGTFGMFAAAETGSSAAVPEPGAYAMLLAGLGVLAVARRRMNT